MPLVKPHHGRGNLIALAGAGALAVLGIAIISIGFAHRAGDSDGAAASPAVHAATVPAPATGVPRDIEGVVSAFAGSGARGFADGAGRDAIFNRPADLVRDRGGVLYVADAGNDLIRRVAPDGTVTVLAGSGMKGYTDGASHSARFNNPTGIAIDSQGNLYVADTGNDLIRKISVEGVVTTLAGLGERGYGDGSGRTARFNAPTAIVIDGHGDLLVADSGNDLIRKVTPDGAVTTYAGAAERGYADGDLHTAKFNAPAALAFDARGNLYVADTGNDAIRRIAPDGAVTTYAGAGERGYAGGSASDARFNAPSGLVFDQDGALYVADTGNDLIRRIAPDGTVSTFAGAPQRGFADGAARSARFNAPARLLLDPIGVFYIADEGNNMIRRLDFDRHVTTLAGSGATGYADGARRDAIFNHPSGAVVDGQGTIYIADAGNDLIRMITADGAVTTISGAGVRGYADGPAKIARFNSPADLALDYFGALYVADTGNDMIRVVGADGSVRTLAGSGERGYRDGTAHAAQFNNPAAVALDTNGNVYVADTGNDVVRKVTAEGVVTTLAGTGERGYVDGPARSARFNSPSGVVVDGQGNVYVADTGNDLIRKITPDGVVVTLAGSVRGYADGNGAAARFNAPTRLAFDFDGTLYVADAGNDTIRAITADGTVTTFAGTGVRGYADGRPAAAQFNTPSGITADQAGNVYIADAGNGIIRTINPGR
jgi:sugar lactone lactonase YvrE